MSGRNKKGNANKFSLEDQKVLTNLDPKLQQVVLEAKEGSISDRSIAIFTESGDVEVDVIAKLKDPNAPINGLTVVQRIGQIVTGYVNVTDVEPMLTADMAH